MDQAAEIAALGLANSDLAPALQRLGERQDMLLDDIIHEFALTGRKLGELVRRERLSSARVWKDNSVLALYAPDSDDPDVETEVSLATISNFVIHSDRFEIERGKTPASDGDETETPAAWTFVVQSDPERNPAHLIYIDLWLEAFLSFEEAIRRDLPPLRLER